MTSQENFAAIELLADQIKYLLFNVYFPSDNKSFDNFIRFQETLASISSVLDDSSITQVILIGDMNSHPNRGQYWATLEFFVREYNFCFADVKSLPDDTHIFERET